MTYPAQSPSYALPVYGDAIMACYKRMVAKAVTRDRNHDLIRSVRRGYINQLFPAELDFSLTFQGSPIANFVDIVAHDMAEGIAPLPSLACVSGRMETDADQRRAEIKNRLGDNYWRHSRLEMQMLQHGADWYVTYGFLPMLVEPDNEAYLPRITLIDPARSYYELDRFGNTVMFAHCWYKSVDELCAMFPQWSAQICGKNPNTGKPYEGDTRLEYVLWVDDNKVCLLLPEREGLVLGSYQHRMKRCPVKIAERPSDSGTPRGQFDDVIWVQVARAIMATLALEAAYVAVEAPIAVPDDMDELPVGPHAVLQSKEAQQIHKVDLRLPETTFQETANLDNELRIGSRYPEARSGGLNASVITGKGVEALLGTFDSQIKGAQIIFKQALEDVTAWCFEMDEIWFPDVVKTVSGTMTGTSYEFQYSAAKTIAGRYSCTVTYGFAAGLRDPAQAIVTILQLQGAGLVAKGTAMQHLPMPIDPIQETRRINVEGSREAMKQGFFALVQASGQMAAQGQDPTPYLRASVAVIRALENGKPVEDAIDMAFEQLEQEQQQAAAAQMEAMQQQAGAPDQFEGANGTPEAGVPSRQAPGQAGQPPGGRPTIAEMVAGFRGNGNLPVNQFDIRRAVPTGT